MNLIFLHLTDRFLTEEVKESASAESETEFRLSSRDPRFVHIFEVLNAENDQRLKIGVCNAGVGTARLNWRMCAQCAYSSLSTVLANWCELDVSSMKFPIYLQMTLATARRFLPENVNVESLFGCGATASLTEGTESTESQERAKSTDTDSTCEKLVPFAFTDKKTLVVKRVGPYYGRRCSGFKDAEDFFCTRIPSLFRARMKESVCHDLRVINGLSLFDIKSLDSFPETASASVENPNALTSSPEIISSTTSTIDSTTLPIHRLPAKIPPKFDIDVVLACPRPKVIDKLISSLATFGVRKIFLIKANKVESTYFDGKRLSREILNEHLLNGLSQAGGCYTRLPEVEILHGQSGFQKNFGSKNVLDPKSREGGLAIFRETLKRKVFHANSCDAETKGEKVLDEMDVESEDNGELQEKKRQKVEEGEKVGEKEIGERDNSSCGPLRNEIRLVAHPGTELKVREVLAAKKSHKEGSGFEACESHRALVTLAIGPEGGWLEEEVDILESEFGFEKVTLGPRILKTTDACLSLLALIYDALE